MQRTAHSLKGSSSYFGAARLQQHARQLEEIGKGGDTADAAAVLSVLELEMSQLQHALREMVEAHS
jgi:HPt (histidine-containing phosphotransfer) domain-containing protein